MPGSAAHDRAGLAVRLIDESCRACRYRLRAPRQELATIAPIAFEAVRKIDAVFMAERAISSLSSKRRLAVRRAEIAPMVRELIASGPP